MNEVFEVAIIGGGSAGSSAGTLLAKAGRRVVIFEKEKFPRFSVPGESTLPATSNTLERMGVREKIDRGGFLIKHGGEIVSACGKRVPFYFRNGFKSNKPLFGDRWLLAGDAAGFIDPVFSSGVYLALLSGQQAADSLNLVLDQPQKRTKAFRHYERRVSRVLDIYLRWASAWYTQEFVEVFLLPKKIFELVRTVSAVLSGKIRDFGTRWRLCIFHILIALQKRTSKEAPKLTLTPKVS
jgi:flavin-dependent dehydrogenase